MKKERLYVRKIDGDVVASILVSSIQYIYGTQFLCNLVTLDNNFFAIKPLSVIHKRIMPFGFIRIHDHILVNSELIRSIDVDKRVLKLPNHALPIGTKYLGEINSKIQKIIIENE